MGVFCLFCPYTEAAETDGGFCKLRSGIHHGDRQAHGLRSQGEFRAAQQEHTGPTGHHMLHHGQKIRPVSVWAFSGFDAIIDDPHEGILLFCLRDQVRHTGFPKGVLIQLSGKRPLCGQNSHA